MALICLKSEASPAALEARNDEQTATDRNQVLVICVSLSDPEALKQLGVGDFIIVARGRRYFSNDALISALRDRATPIIDLKLGPVPSAKVYELDEASLTLLTQSGQ